MLLKIDQELKNLIPPLTHEDRTGLENNIKANGCETPITVWDGTIIDGHNRYEICIANGIPFEVKEMSFADKDDAKIWMIKHELEWKGRKITPAIRSHLGLMMNDILQEQAKRKEYERKTTFLKSEKSNLPPMNTVKEIAKIADVSPDTISKMKVIEAEATPEQLKDVMDSEKSINKVYQEIKGSKLKTPEHLMDKFEPEEIVHEHPQKEEEHELKGMCPCGCGYRYDEENKEWYNENNELINMVAINVDRNTYERFLRRKKDPEENPSSVINRILDGDIHEQPR